MKNNKNLISIIIRGKNESKWLKILFQELDKQTYKKFEIIYCDNSSYDNSINVAKKFNIKKIFKIKHYTPGLSLNAGIKRANGKFIVILSSHCIPCNKNWLSNYVKFMEKNPKFIAAYGRQIPLPGTSTKDLLDLDVVFPENKSSNYLNNYLNNANSIYDAKYLKKNLFDEKLQNIEDRSWMNKRLKEKKNIGYVNNSEVFHIHGINQHNSSSGRSISTSKILLPKFSKYWKNCKFIQVSYFKYAILINARRETNKKKLEKKIKKLLLSSFFNKLKINKIFIISDERISFKIKNYYINSISPKDSLSQDLKNLYKKNFKTWIEVDYILSLNAVSNWSKNNIKKITNYCVLNSCDSVSLAEKIYGNFIVNFKDGATIKSLSLDKRENKPVLDVMKWTEGCIFTPNYLIQGAYVDEKTKLYYK